MRNLNFWLRISSFYGFLGVAMGAFGAHGMKARLSTELFAVFETASRYCLTHAVVLLAVAILSELKPSATIERSGWFFTLGIAVFSGTLWILAITGYRWLGAITPVGGVLLILGWGTLFFAATTKEIQ